VLAACLPVKETMPTPAWYQLDGGGIEVAYGKRIDFGRTQNSTIMAMNKIIGISEGELFECDDLVVATFPGGVGLIFEQNNFGEWSFRGWQTEDRSAGLICSSA
jgi:hypothetical protein